MTLFRINRVTPDIAQHVLWHYGIHQDDGDLAGYPPGSFVESLLKTIGKADQENRARLEISFPGYIQTCNMIENYEHGIKVLLDKANERMK